MGGGLEAQVQREPARPCAFERGPQSAATAAGHCVSFAVAPMRLRRLAPGVQLLSKSPCTITQNEKEVPMLPWPTGTIGVGFRLIGSR